MQAETPDPARPWRGTIFVDEGHVIWQQTWPGEQFVMRIHAPQTAAAALPGSFAHIRCDDALPMRRPLSIMRADPDAGWIEVLYKIVGDGLRALSRRVEGDSLSVMGPIGRPFTPNPERPRALLIGGGVGIPPMIFLAEALRGDNAYSPLVLMGSEIPFPFKTVPSTLLVPGMPAGAIGAVSDLEDIGVPSRLASKAGYSGCFDGFITELAAHWLESMDDKARREVEIYACGPTPMLAACAEVARHFDVPAQVSLEEFMACATGGCAGCAVPVHTPDGVAMKRVCVDGPVFDATQVFPPDA